MPFPNDLLIGGILGVSRPILACPDGRLYDDRNLIGRMFGTLIK
jgi:hypothetical protein